MPRLGWASIEARCGKHENSTVGVPSDSHGFQNPHARGFPPKQLKFLGETEGEEVGRGHSSDQSKPWTAETAYGPDILKMGSRHLISVSHPVLSGQFSRASSLCGFNEIRYQRPALVLWK